MTRRSGQGALKASALGMTARVLRAATRIIVVVFLARWYDDSTVAHFSYGFVVGSLLGMLSDAGVSEYVVREIGARAGGQRELQRAAIGFRALTIPLVFAIGWGITTIRYSDALISLGAVGLALALSMAELFASIRRGQGRYDLECWESAPPVLAVGIALCLGAMGAGVRDFHAALALASWGFIGMRLLLVRMHRAENVQSKLSIWHPARASRWFFIKGLVTWVLFEANVVLLEYLGDARALALFAIAVRPAGLLSLPMGVVGLVFTPALARTHAVDRSRFPAAVLRLNLIHLTLLPGAFGLCLLGGDIVLGFAGITDGRSVLLMLALAYVAYTSTLSGVPFIAMGQERIVASVSAMGAVALLLFGIALIPRFGALGAASASAAAFGLTKLAYIGWYRNYRLPLGDRLHVLSAVMSSLYVLALTWLQGTIYYAVLGIGIISSLGATARLMMKTRLFAEPEESRRGPAQVADGITLRAIE